MPERLPHQNLLATARFSLGRAVELLPTPDQISDQELVELAACVEDIMNTLVTLGDAVKEEQQLRSER